MRKASALIVTAGLLMATLTACSGPGAAAADCDSPVKAGPASELVSVTGKFGNAPKVDFPTPLKTKTTERSEILAGHGAPLQTGQKVKIDLSVYNGTTGEVLQAAKYDETNLTTLTLTDKVIKGLTDGLTCTQVGSRQAVAVAPKDAFGPQGGNPDLGVAATDTLVFVVDVVKAYLPRANGTPQPVANGLPGVVLAADGRPGITVPSGDVPTKLEIGVLKKGDGPKVKEGEQVTVHYTGVLWDKDIKKPFDSSWESGEPAQLMAADGSKTQGGVIPGLAKALIGQTVGSQVVAVIPPDEGYGDKATGPIPAGSTLIFVIDILGVN